MGRPLGAPHTRIATPKSFAKKSRSHACVSDFRKESDQSPGMVVYFRFILAFLEQHLGNFSRNSFGTAAHAEVPTFSTLSTDRAGSGWRIRSDSEQLRPVVRLCL
jgi:hypothetical protein